MRREEQQWQSRCTLLIDNRRTSHRGYGADSSMETAVRAAASIMRNLVALDFEVRLVSATGRSSAHGWHQCARGATLSEQLERLALMGMTRNEQLSTGWVDESPRAGCCSRCSVTSGRRTATSSPGWPTPAIGARRGAGRVELEPHGSREPPATASLRSGGWKATTLDRDGALAAAWLELAR